MKKEIWIALILFILIGTTILCLVNIANTKIRTIQQQGNLIAALQDSIRSYKTTNSSHVATISVIQTESVDAFNKLKVANAQIQDLQRIATQYKGKLTEEGSITKALIETVIDSIKPTTPSNYTFRANTLNIDSSNYRSIIFKQSLHNEWIDYSASIGYDTSSYSIRIKNQFSAIIGNDKGRPFVDLLTENPYSSVKSLRTFNVKAPPVPIKKWGIGPAVGVGFDNSLKPTLFLGITLQYSLIRF